MTLIPQEVIDQCIAVAVDVAKLAVLIGGVACLGILFFGVAR